MKVIGTFRRDPQGEFLPESADAQNYEGQLSRALKIGRLLQDTQRDADILKQSGNGRSAGGAVLVSDTTFAGSDDIRKATSLSYDSRSGEIHSYSARIVSPSEKIRLQYSARPLMLELNSSNQSGNAGRINRRLRFQEVGDNLFELSEGV